MYKWVFDILETIIGPLGNIYQLNYVYLCNQSKDKYACMIIQYSLVIRYNT